MRWSTFGAESILAAGGILLLLYAGVPRQARAAVDGAATESEGPRPVRMGEELSPRLRVSRDAAEPARRRARPSAPFDDVAPENLSLDQPSASVDRASVDTSNGQTTLEVTYSYDEANPDTTTITVLDGNGNEAVYGFNDSGRGESVERTAELNLENPPNTRGDSLAQEGDYDIELRATDQDDNAQIVTADNRLTIDNTAPSITGTRRPPDGLYGIGDVLTFEVDYDEAVVVDESGGTPSIALDVDGTTRSARYASGSGSSTLTFTYEVQAGDDDSDGIAFEAPQEIQLNGGTIKDEAGNDAGRDFSDEAGTLSGVRLDGTTPANVSVDAPTNTPVLRRSDETLEVDYSYDEARPDTATMQFTDGGGNAATFGRDDSGDGESVAKTVTLDLSSPAEGDLTDGTYDLTLTAVDSAGNDGASTASALLEIDDTPPAIDGGTVAADNGGVSVDGSEGVYSNADATGDLTAGSVDYSFSRNGGAATDISIEGVTHTAGDATVDVQISVTDGPASGEEEVEIGPVDGSSIYDAAGNNMDGGQTTGTLSLKDRKAPAVDAVRAPADGLYGIGDPLTFEVDYDEPVEVDESGGTPSIALNVAGTTRSARYASGSGSSTLTFTYEVQAGDDDPDGIAFDSQTIQLNGGVLADTVGNDAAVDFSGVAPDLGGVTTDGTRPSINTFALSNPSGQDVAVTIETDEGLGGTESDLDVTLARDGTTVGTLTRLDFEEEGTTYTTTYAGSQDGTYSATLNTARDEAGNDGAGGEADEVVVDTTPPADLSLDTPGAQTVRTSVSDHNGRTGLTVGYSYEEPHPEQTTIKFVDDQGTAVDSVQVDDSGYTSGNEKTEGIDLTAKDLAGGQVYDLRVTSTDTAGNEASIIEADRVEVDNTPPDLISESKGEPATVVDDTLTLNYNESLDETSVPGTGAFAVRVDGSDRSVSDVGVSSGQVVLTLGTAVGPSDGNVDVDYDSTTASPLRDPGSENEALSFTGVSADNQTDDTTPPSITGVTGPADSLYGLGDVLTFEVNYDEAVEVDESGGTPAIELDIGGTTRSALFASGSGTQTLSFAYTVQSGDDDGDGIQVTPEEIQLNGGTLTDAAGNDAQRNLSGEVPDLSAVRTDGTRPTISEVTLSNDGADNLAFEFTSDEALTTVSVTVDGPNNGAGWPVTLDETDLAETQDGTYRYELDTQRAYDDGSGTYTAVVDAALDAAENDGAETDDSDTYVLPAVEDVAAATDENTVLSVSAPGVLDNDSPAGLSVTAVNGDAGAVGTQISLASGALLTINADGSYDYDPNGAFDALTDGEVDSDAVTYTASDGEGGSAQATVTVQIEGVNDVPTIDQNETLSVASTGGTEPITTSELSASDPDNAAEELTFAVTTEPSNGTLLLNGSSTNSFTQQDLENTDLQYEHDGTDTSLDNFGFEVSDGVSRPTVEDTFEIAIDVENLSPTARDDEAATGDDAPFAVTDSTNGLLGNDSDPDDDPLSVTEVNGDPDNVGVQVSLSSGALLTVNEDGTYAYDPNEAFELTRDESTTDAFSYTLADGRGGTDQATVTITINGSNGPPTASDVQYLTGAGQSLSVSDPANGVLANDSDPDGDALRASVVGEPSNGALTLERDGTFEYTPNDGYDGVDAFTYEAADGSGGTDRATAEIQVRPAQTTLTGTRRFPDPTAQQSFRLVALPGAADTPLSSTVSGQEGDDWRAFREEGGSGSESARRERCGSGTPCPFRAGEGYWLIARDAWEVEASFETVALESDSTTGRPVHRISLQDGWNIVSNPVETDIAWDEVQAASGTEQPLWRWDGAWEQVQTFASATSGEAYYFRDDGIDQLVLPFPGLSTRSRGQTKQTGTPPDSTLALDLIQDGDTVSTVRVGVRSDAAMGLDRTDRYAPPNYFDAATLRLVTEEEGRTSPLSAEHVPPGRDGYSFALRVHAPSDGALTVARREAAAVGEREMALVHPATGRTYDLRSDSAAAIAPDAETAEYRLLIGSRAFVEEAKDELAPDAVTLLPNYPNPFREETTLEYTLPDRQEVRIEVYDVMGRRVQVLVDEVQSAGFHRVQWRGGDGGRSVASGVYFARLTAGSVTRTERLVIVR